MVIAKTAQMRERFQAPIVCSALLASLMNIQMEESAKLVKLVRFLTQTALDVTKDQNFEDLVRNFIKLQSYHLKKFSYHTLVTNSTQYAL